MSERMTAAERKRVAEALRDGVGCTRDLLRLAADLIDPPEPPGTVRVRVACVVRADGVWCAEGHSQQTDAESRQIAEEGVWSEVAGDPRLTWVEALVPLPAPPATVEGSVA